MFLFLSHIYCGFNSTQNSGMEVCCSNWTISGCLLLLMDQKWRVPSMCPVLWRQFLFLKVFCWRFHSTAGREEEKSWSAPSFLTFIFLTAWPWEKWKSGIFGFFSLERKSPVWAGNARWVPPFLWTIGMQPNRLSGSLVKWVQMSLSVDSGYLPGEGLFSLVVFLKPVGNLWLSVVLKAHRFLSESERESLGSRFPWWTPDGLELGREGKCLAPAWRACTAVVVIAGLL